MSNSGGAVSKICSQLNWGLGSGGINREGFDQMDFVHLPFSKMQKPLNTCGYIRVFLPTAGLTKSEGDPVVHAVVEAGNQQGVNFHAKPTLRFTLTDIIPTFTSANNQVASTDVGLIILHP